MPAALPQRTRIYQCHHLDSTRWDDVVPRPDDIIITTSLKAGTTWTQRIVSLLVFQTLELPKSLHFVSPWPDSRFILGRDEMRDVVEGLEHRRFLKTPWRSMLCRTGSVPDTSTSGGTRATSSCRHGTTSTPTRLWRTSC